MSLFIFSLLLGFLLYQIVSAIQPIAPAADDPNSRIRIGRRVTVELPERTYLAWKAGILAAAILLFISVTAIIVAQNLHPPEGFAYRFVDALTAPRMAAAMFGGLVGLLLGNLLNRILRAGQEYKFTAPDYLELVLIFFLVILGIGGEEFLQSYVRRINKISIGATTEISFSENQPKQRRTAAEQPGTSYQTSDVKDRDKRGSTGLQKLAVLHVNITFDKRYINVLSLYEQGVQGTIGDSGSLPEKFFNPIAECLSDIFQFIGDGEFVNQQLSELSRAVRALTTSSLPMNSKDISDVGDLLQKPVRALAEYIKTTPQIACKKFRGARENIVAITQDVDAIETFTKERKLLPYVAIAYASVMAALNHYESSAITLQNWINEQKEVTTVAQKWYVLRARTTLTMIVEEWLRERGTAASSWLRLFHLENLKATIDGMHAFVAISALSQGNRDHKLNVGLLSASHSGDEGVCKYPAVPASARPQRNLDPDEQDNLRFLDDSYLAARSTYLDHALKHPILKERYATVIQSQAEELMALDLKCIAPESRPAARAEYLERYVRSEMNLLEKQLPLKSTDEIRTRVSRAQQILTLARHLIDPEVTKALSIRESAADLPTRIGTEPILELSETLFATQDQLKKFSEHETTP